MLNFQSPHFLRRVLMVDGATCIATGLLLTLAAGALETLLRLPAGLLREAGLLLFPFAAMVLYGAARAQPPRALVWIAIAGNALWAAGSIALLMSSLVAPNGLGQAFVVAQAVAVALLAELEYFGLRRLPAAA